MIDTKQLYREKTLRIPRPAFIVLYNGPEDIPEYQELRLSDAYLGDKEEREEDALQLIVKVYNINTGKNAEILKKCETLRQYSRFVEIVRSYGHIDQLTSAAMVQIMAQCQQENVLTEFMEHYGTELIEMLFKELTREEDLEISRLDGYDAGVKDGEKSGISKGERKAALDIAKGMKRKNLDSSVITELTGLSLAGLRNCKAVKQNYKERPKCKHKWNHHRRPSNDRLIYYVGTRKVREPIKKLL